MKNGAHNIINQGVFIRVALGNKTEMPHQAHIQSLFLHVLVLFGEKEGGGCKLPCRDVNHL